MRWILKTPLCSCHFYYKWIVFVHFTLKDPTMLQRTSVWSAAFQQHNHTQEDKISNKANITFFSEEPQLRGRHLWFFKTTSLSIFIPPLSVYFLPSSLHLYISNTQHASQAAFSWVTFFFGNMKFKSFFLYCLVQTKLQILPSRHL